MRVSIKKVYNTTGQETGSILSSSFGHSINVQQKIAIENQLIQYGFDNLYPGEGLNIFREMHSDTASVIIIRNINNLPETIVNI
jgi:hypothetical protein